MSCTFFHVCVIRLRPFIRSLWAECLLAVARGDSAGRGRLGTLTLHSGLKVNYLLAILRWCLFLIAGYILIGGDTGEREGERDQAGRPKGSIFFILHFLKGD